MLDGILSVLKDQITDKIDDFGISKDQAGQAVDIAQESVLSSVMSAASGGGIGGLLNMFNGKESVGSNSMIGGIVSNYTSDLIEKVGISSDKADMIAKFAVPFIMSKINDNTPDDGVDEGGFMDIIKQSAAKEVKKSLFGGLANLFK